MVDCFDNYKRAFTAGFRFVCKHTKWISAHVARQLLFSLLTCFDFGAFFSLNLIVRILQLIVASTTSHPRHFFFFHYHTFSRPCSSIPFSSFVLLFLSFLWYGKLCNYIQFEIFFFIIISFEFKLIDCSNLACSQMDKHDDRSFDYGFPYEPYDIQRLLVQKIQDTIQRERVGVLASPTGTGKSLSVICAVCDWILKERQLQRENVLRRIQECEDNIQRYQSDTKTVDWIKVQQQQMLEQRKLDQIRQELDVWHCYDRIRIRLDTLRRQLKMNMATIKSRMSGPNFPGKRIKLDHVESEANETALQPDQFCPDEEKVILSDSLNVSNQPQSDSDEVTEKDRATITNDLNVRHVPKIVYSSRTHSQLTQFIHEFQKTMYKDQVRLISLGSRQNLCVNPSVRSLKHSTLINDRCMELNNTKKCPYYRSNLMDELANRLLAIPLDIEQAHEAGKDVGCCSYYGEKRAVPQAELIVVPYNILLNDQTRSAYSLSLDDCVVIIDEAHNLSDTISDAYSVKLSGRVLTACREQINAYVEQYNKRLSPSNLLHLKQLLMLLGAFEATLKVSEIAVCGSTMNPIASNVSNNFTRPESNLNLPNTKADVQVFTPIAYLIKANVDNFNLFKLIEFCETNQLARKLFGFAIVTIRRQKNLLNGPHPLTSVGSKQGANGTSAFLARMAQEKAKKTNNKKLKAKQNVLQNQSKPNMELSATCATAALGVTETKEKLPGSPLFQVLDLLRALTNSQDDGRVLIVKDRENSFIKYLHLDNSKRFAPIAQQCRSLILIGGTMEPVSEFVDLLECNQSIAATARPIKQIEFFDCDHIVPQENLLAVSVDCGPTGQRFSFQHHSKQLPSMMTEAGNMLVNLCNIVPGGVVVFFTSYMYEQIIFKHWNQQKIIDRIENRGKRVFREPRTAAEVPNILAEYSKCVREAKSELNVTKKSTGAVLLSVVGGKMSEGINFNDDLGRCVVLFGLPFPNMCSPELTEKLNYFDTRVADSYRKSNQSNSIYLNMCMKAVNQSIGRAIRHRNDYATIWLVDARYGTDPNINSRLPSWIRKSYHNSLTFSQAFRKTSDFFRQKHRLNSNQ